MSNEDRSKHHPYGPSRWPGLCVCPGYTPSSEGGEFADRGTAIHEALETGDFSKLREEDRETAEWMNCEREKLTQGIENVIISGDNLKTRINASAVVHAAVVGVTGTCDATWVTEDGSRHVLDYKGFSQIGLTDHRAQLAGYFLGLPRAANGRYVAHIFHGGSRQVETVEMTLAECCSFAYAVGDAIENPSGPRCRSRHCDHCAKAGDCAESVKAVAFGNLAAGRLTKDAVRADPASAARLCDWLDAAAKRIEEARDIIASVAKEGTAIEDPATGIAYGVQERKGRPSVPPVSDILDRLIDKDGVSREAVLERSTLSMKALGELVGKSRAEEYAVRGEPTLCFVRVTRAKALKGG